MSFEVGVMFLGGSKGYFCSQGNCLEAKENLIVKEGKVLSLKTEAGCNEKIPRRY